MSNRDRSCRACRMQVTAHHKPLGAACSVPIFLGWDLHVINGLDWLKAVAVSVLYWALTTGVIG